MLSGFLLPPFVPSRPPAYWTVSFTFRVGLAPPLLSHMSIIAGHTLSHPCNNELTQFTQSPRSVLS
jgi:hypothetical protein